MRRLDPATDGPAPKVMTRFTTSTLDRLDELARERGVTRSTIVRALVDEALDRETAAA